MKKWKCLDGLTLKIIAMALMLCDHMWATVLSQYTFLTVIGRLAFPIFAFEMVEGYFHTHSKKRLFGRLLVFALLSEIPFNLMAGGSWRYPFHQNVLFTFLLGLGFVHWMECARATGSRWKYGLSAFACLFLGMVTGTLAMVDYFGFGVVTVLLFYFFREGKFAWLGQLVGLYILNVVFMGGRVLPVMLGSLALELPVQGFAVFALVLIWLYNGKPGNRSKPVQLAYYSFYPLHMLILYLFALIDVG